MRKFNLQQRNGCALCKSDEKDTYIPFSQIPVVRCRECGFIYSDKILSGKDLESYYEDNFGGLRQQQGQIVNAKVNFVIIKKLVNIRGINNILDVGCGYGFYLKELLSIHELDATGVELSSQEAEYAKNNLKLNVINSLLKNSGLEKGNYDLVTTHEVIEHIADPVAFINEMGEYVKDGGYLMIMTDNFGGTTAKSLGAGYPKWIPHTHISHFSNTVLENILHNIDGFKLINSMSFTPWELIVRNMYRKLRGISPTPSEAFDLASSLDSEMQSGYKYFHLRKIFNRMWAKFNLRKEMDGDLMYFLLQKNNHGVLK